MSLLNLVRDALGPLLIGSWVNSFLVMLSWSQAYRYYTTYRNDEVLIKLAVAVCLVADAATTSFEFYAVYEYCVTNWGDISYVAKVPLPWPFAAYTVTTALSNMIVQLYLIWRVGRLMSSRVLRYIVLGTLLAGLVTAFSGALWTAVEEATIVAGSDTIVRSSAIVWLGTSAGTDILVSIAFIWRLMVMKKSRPVDNMVNGRSSSMIHRLAFGAVKTGSATAAIALLALATFFGSTTTTSNVAVCYVIGRVSTLTLLFNLNARESLSKTLPSTMYPSQTGYSSAIMGMGTRPVIPSQYLSDGVHVTSGTVVHIDEGEPLPTSRRMARAEMNKLDEEKLPENSSVGTF